jgi:hypothetical protein
MAQLDRLQRDRASLASAKRDAGEQLGRQGRELGELRERLLTERSRAGARRDREHARRQWATIGPCHVSTYHRHIPSNEWMTSVATPS